MKKLFCVLLCLASLVAEANCVSSAYFTDQCPLVLDVGQVDAEMSLNWIPYQDEQNQDQVLGMINLKLGALPHEKICELADKIFSEDVDLVSIQTRNVDAAVQDLCLILEQSYDYFIFVPASSDMTENAGTLLVSKYPIKYTPNERKTSSSHNFDAAINQNGFLQKERSRSLLEQFKCGAEWRGTGTIVIDRTGVHVDVEIDFTGTDSNGNYVTVGGSANSDGQIGISFGGGSANDNNQNTGNFGPRQN